MKLYTTTGLIIFENDKSTISETLSDAIKSGIKDMDNINLSDQVLTGIDLSNISLNGAYFKGVSVTDSKFIGCQFEWADFTYSEFKDCDFSKSEFLAPYFNGASFLNCGFRNAKIKGQQYIEPEGSIFTGSDMTGIQMSDIHFNRSDFRDVLFERSVMNMVVISHGIFSKDTSFNKSIFHKVCMDGSNLNCANYIDITEATDCLMEGLNNKTNMAFFSEPLIIKPENKLTVYRFNFGNSSPFAAGKMWDYNSKSVRTNNNSGLYGYLSGTPGCLWISAGDVFSKYANNNQSGKDPLEDSRVILKLEVDKNSILYNGYEVAFSECNIIEVINPIDFIAQNYPQYKDLLELYKKSLNDPETYFSQFKSEYSKYSRELQLQTGYNSPPGAVNELDLQKSQLEIIKTYAINHARPSDIHGLSHWQNVERNAILLAEKTGADLQALKVFAYVHDLCRENDGSDLEHGLRASKFVKEHSGSLLRGVMNSYENLCFACENHTRMLRSGDITIDTCFDADRLDLTRVGITPDPDKMATEAGAYYAANPDIYKAEIANVQI